MDKLIAVEYMSFTGNHKEKDDRAFLDGCLGEVRESDYKRALRQVRSLPKGANSKNIHVPVRFPLAAPLSNVGFYPTWACTPYDTEEQGIKVPLRNLRISRKTPLSSFERRPLPTDPGAIPEVFESKFFYETFSHANFFQALESLMGRFSHNWFWYAEGAIRAAEKPLLFVSARFYGADNLIPVYSPKRLKGVAVQILTRDILSGYKNRMATDVMLLTDSDEYVSYVDGVQIEREKIKDKTKTLRGLYASPYLISAKAMQKRMLANKPKEAVAAADKTSDKKEAR